MFPSEPLSAVIFNHGSTSRRDKCVSDYVVNYEIEILRISLNFFTEVSLLHFAPNPSLNILPTRFWKAIPRYGFRLSGFPVYAALKWIRPHCCTCGFLGGYSTDYWPGIDLPLNALPGNWESLASSFSNKIACGPWMVWWRKRKKKTLVQMDFSKLRLHNVVLCQSNNQTRQHFSLCTINK